MLKFVSGIFFASAFLIAQPCFAADAGETAPMETVKAFLSQCRSGGAFFIATMDKDSQPRVRPFGALATFEGKLYLCTGNGKKVYRQLKENPKTEISGYAGGEWIRLEALAVEDTRREAKEAMLEQNPGLRKTYSADDGVFAVFYLKNAKASILSFKGRDDKYEF